MKIKMVNEFGMEKKVKKGFSWTIFFFGWIALMFRGQITEFLIYVGGFIIMVLSGLLLAIPIAIILIIYTLYLSFVGNKKLLEQNLKNGYKIVQEKNN